MSSSKTITSFFHAKEDGGSATRRSGTKRTRAGGDDTDVTASTATSTDVNATTATTTTASNEDAATAATATTQTKRAKTTEDKAADTTFNPTAVPLDGDTWVDSLDQLIHPSWRPFLSSQFKQPYFNTLRTKLRQEVKAHGTKAIFPPPPLIFAAFNECPFDRVKVVIIGQDPYHDNGQAHGMCFSVPMGVRVPSSLQNIYKELSTDIAGFKIPKHGHLSAWAKQGVLLLNATLTVRAHQPNSHKTFGWQEFTNAAIKALSAERRDIVFLLWGTFAQDKSTLIAADKHHVLKTVHPSGLSAHRGFFGCHHFSKCNELLKKSGQTPIEWQL